MNDEIKKEWRRAFWSLVITAIIAVSGAFFQSYIMTKTLSDKVDILTKEQSIIRSKVDLIQLQIERKVDRNTLDNCLTNIDHKLDNIQNNIFKIQQKTN